MLYSSIVKLRWGGISYDLLLIDSIAYYERLHPL